MSEAKSTVIGWDECRGDLVVMLNGVVQRGVCAADPVDGWVERGYQGPFFKDHQWRSAGGFVFDTDADDFVIERVEGRVEAYTKASRMPFFDAPCGMGHAPPCP